jgi:hypothetical protein
LVRSLPNPLGRAPDGVSRTDVEKNGVFEASLDVRRVRFVTLVQLLRTCRRLLDMIQHNTTISPSTARTTGCVTR